MTINTTASKKSMFEGRKLWFAFGAGAAIIVAILTFVLMSKVIARDSYYIVADGVTITARHQITPDMLKQVDVPHGGVPAGALGFDPSTGKEDINALVGRWAKFNILAGDVITETNTSDPQDEIKLTAGLPDDFVITSFSADPNLSAGGNVRRGDYIDIAMVGTDSNSSTGTTAKFVLQHVLIIDANAGAASVGVDQSTGTVSGINGRNVVPSLYTVGLSPENALRLLVAQQSGTLFVVLSSVNSSNGEVGDNPCSGYSNCSVSESNLWETTVPDGGAGTDPQFGTGDGSTSTPSQPNGPSEPNSPSKPSSPSTPTAPSTPTPSGTPTPSSTPTPSETVTP